ncbi:MAG: M1 family aminopeptidase [Bacteroidetes bacterium]|nr:M1 family aminopeptidase [Bacteroidota bacterium]
MKKFVYILIVLNVGCFPGFSQKPTTLNDFYKSEWSNFKDYIKIRNGRGNTDTTFNITFYYLKADVSLDANAKYIRGNLLCKFKSSVNNLVRIVLSLQDDLHVDSITGNSSTYSISGDSINIMLDRTYSNGEAAEIRIWYQGVPQLAGGYKGLRYETHHNGEPVIATLSTPYLAHYWYPCKDGPEDKADSVYLDITVPDTVINGNKAIAVSNGLLENVTTVNNKVTYCWRHRYPIVTYYVMMAISNYSHFQQSFIGPDGESFPIDYFVFGEHDSISRLGVSEMPDVMQFYSNLFGKYPFWKEKYAMSELGYYGAIENQTNTITNSMDISWFYVSAHELSHMWFGDMITCADWHHAWMNEGFATYAEALWTEHKNGMAAYHSYLNSTAAFMGGTLYLQNDLDTFNIFQEIVYSKGAWVLHMLRGVLGDQTFFNCLKSYAGSPGFMYKNASTEDFRHLAENTSGKNLAAFFNQWVYDAYYPMYHFNYKQDSSSKVLTLHIFQAQASISNWREVFEMPLQVKITDVNGNDTIITVQNNQKNQEYQFRLTGYVNHDYTSVVIDPDKWVIRKTYFKPNLPVGLPEVPDERMAFNLYPDPASDQLNIGFPQPVKKAAFKIFNQFGELVNSGFLKSTVSSISINNLSRGLYFIVVDDGKTQHSEKFMKL